MRVCPHRIGEQVDFHTADNPNDLWPQTTWQQDTSGTFAIASSSAHALGSTGGSETHTLTVQEMPSHGHTMTDIVGIISGTSTSVPRSRGNFTLTSYWNLINVASGTRYDAYGPGTWTIPNSGGGSAHSIMPPFVAVNRWKRVA